jgi:hypothetical protein
MLPPPSAVKSQHEKARNVEDVKVESDDEFPIYEVYDPLWAFGLSDEYSLDEK